MNTAEISKAVLTILVFVILWWLGGGLVLMFIFNMTAGLFGVTTFATYWHCVCISAIISVLNWTIRAF